MFGNISSVTTPIIINDCIQTMGSFNDALVFIGVNALVAAGIYLVFVGESRRVNVASASA